MEKLKNVDTKKAIAFIKANANKVPESTRTGHEYILPSEIITEIENQMDVNDGAFAIDKAKFNAQFGWSQKNSRSLYLQKKLNKQYPRRKGKEWHVGTIQRGELYKFEVVDIKATETKEEE